MDYVQITPPQRTEMLTAIGATSIEDLLKQVPDSIRLHRPLHIPAGLDELSLRSHLTALANKNKTIDQKVCFLGAGAYDHFIPTVVDALAMKGEFVTAYTPYQPEASQGSLQAFFEFQTMICQLTGLDVSNASLYEGATAFAEAALMSLNITGKRQILVSQGIHPHYRQVLKTYLSDLPAQYIEIPLENGLTPVPTFSNDTAAVLIQSPNFLGHIENVPSFSAAAHAAGSLCVQSYNPISLGLLKRPGQMDVDIATADGQPLGIPLQFGGPYLGLFSAKAAHLRKMPGRLVGQTVDSQGKRAFCLTLQTREQHIRREKATSNVCTNQGLLALRAAVYLSAMGPQGLREAAQLSYNKTIYLKSQLASKGLHPVHPHAPHFNELLIQLKHPIKEVLKRAADSNILPGYDPSSDFPTPPNSLLIATTEKRTKTEIDQLVSLLT